MFCRRIDRVRSSTTFKANCKKWPSVSTAVHEMMIVRCCNRMYRQVSTYRNIKIGSWYRQDMKLRWMDGWMDGWIRLIVGFSTSHGHITDCKLVCMCWTRLVLVWLAASLYSASPLKHHPTGKQWCPNPDHYSDSEPARRSLTLLCCALSRAAEPSNFNVFCLTRPGIEPPTSRMPGERSTATLSGRGKLRWTDESNMVSLFSKYLVSLIWCTQLATTYTGAWIGDLDPTPQS